MACLTGRPSDNTETHEAGRRTHHEQDGRLAVGLIARGAFTRLHNTKLVADHSWVCSRAGLDVVEHMFNLQVHETFLLVVERPPLDDGRA